jgi:putative flippase GtrA
LVVECDIGDRQVVRASFNAQNFNLRPKVAKLFRYGATSAIALGISEVALLIATAFGITATVSAVIGTLAGVVPSYLMSRYWIWAEAPRARVGRQVTLYWLTSVVSLAITSFATGGGLRSRSVVRFGASHRCGRRVPRYQLCRWVGKYTVYQQFIFVEAQPER